MTKPVPLTRHLEWSSLCRHVRRSGAAMACTAGTLALVPGSAFALLTINPIYNTFDAAKRAVIDDAIQEWAVLFCNPANFSIDIEFVTNNTMADLGLTSGWDFNAQGRPTSPTVAIRTDAHNWTLGAPAAGMDDALDTLKHEIGHALGFTVFGANFAANTLTVAGNRFYDLNHNGIFDGTDFDLIDDANLGTHAPAGSGNLMQPETPQGVRNHPNAKHADVLRDAYGYVPEPSSAILLAAGLFALAGAAGRRRRTNG